jgi:very-short-patch-repair endonuclease
VAAGGGSPFQRGCPKGGGFFNSQMKFIPYNTNLKEFSRNLRSNQTLGETLLWIQLQRRQMRGYEFNRQKPLGNYIVDLYCKKLNLVIEVDGGSHHFEEVSVNDAKRQEILQEKGLHFLRFTEHEVRKNMDKVLFQINGFIDNFENEQV